MKIVRDKKDGGISAETIQGSCNFAFVLPIKPCGGLVTNQDGCFANGSTGNRDALALSARQCRTALAEHGVVLLWHLHNKVVSIGDSRGLSHFPGDTGFFA